jgi:hypothetical protein
LTTDPCYPDLLRNYRRRLSEITPPKTKSEVYERDMLEHDIGRLEVLVRKIEDRAPRK